MTTDPPGDALDQEIFDEPAVIEASGLLAPLLREWNDLVRGETGSVQSFATYDREARTQQSWHQCLVAVAAIAGGAAVLLAIWQLAAFAQPELLVNVPLGLLGGAEYVAAILAIVAVVLGLAVAFHVRWRELRMKAEQYRFLKTHFLLHAEQQLARTGAERVEYLRTMLAGIHALDGRDAHHWAQGTFRLYRDEPAVMATTGESLSADLVRYLRAHRLTPQREYFERQSAERHGNERGTWFVPPACFFLSIVFAFLHFAVEIWSHQHSPHADQPLPSAAAGHPSPTPLMIGCLFGAAAFPVLGALFRTIRTAFEFGRNANRFAGVARILADAEQDLDQPLPPAARMEVLHDAERALQYENRSWMRLMIEAEWFG